MDTDNIDPKVISQILKDYIHSETSLIAVGAFSESQVLERREKINNAQLLLCWIRAAGGEIPFELLDP